MKPLILLFASSFSNPAATHIANYTEALLRANRDTYLRGPHNAQLKSAALAYFDQHWADLQSPMGCGAASLGDAGKRCLADRSRSGRWPWQQYYRDPIENGRL
jgi:hypothetical protein